MWTRNRNEKYFSGSYNYNIWFIENLHFLSNLSLIWIIIATFQIVIRTLKQLSQSNTRSEDCTCIHHPNLLVRNCQEKSDQQWYSNHGGDRTVDSGQVTTMISLIVLLALQGNSQIAALQLISEVPGLTGVLSLLPGHQGACLDRPLELVGDLDNCHIFYQCATHSQPQPRSCGSMLFNSLSQVQSGPPRCRGLLRGIASPAVLCHKEPARASKAPY